MSRKSPRARNALPPEVLTGKAPAPRTPAMTWPAIPRWVPGLRGPIEVVRPTVVVEKERDPETGELQESAVDSRYIPSKRRILIPATVRRPQAWMYLEAERYYARFNDLGLHYVVPAEIQDALCEALARQHMRAFRREGMPPLLPRHAAPEAFPPLPRLVYEWGGWAPVQRPNMVPPGHVAEDLGINLAYADHDREVIVVARQLPRPQAWHALWHERYEARLYESAFVKTLDPDLKEAIADGLATARVIEAQLAHDWATRPETAPPGLGGPPDAK